MVHDHAGWQFHANFREMRLRGWLRKCKPMFVPSKQRQVKENKPMTDYERETVINFNDGEDVAIIYTCNKGLMTKMDKLSKKYPEVCKLKRQDIYSKTFILPKKLVKIETPSTRTRYYQF